MLSPRQDRWHEVNLPERVTERGGGDVVICDQPDSQAKQQCARALVGFGDAEWREAHKTDLCLRRLLELKLSGERW